MKVRNTILITGASSGLGYEMAKHYASRGRNLALCARRIERLEELKDLCKQISPESKISVKTLNVNEHDAVFDVFRQFKDEFGTLDRVVVNAGMGKGASVGTGYFDANKATAITNFVSALAQCEATLEIFREQNSGHLVTISSISAVRGFRRALTVYAATKAGLTSMSEGMRVDLPGSPIKVSTIHPGFIQSEINEKVKKVPFMVDTETGCRAIIKAIEKEKDNAFVPAWPWAFLHYLLRLAPLSVLKSMS